VWQIVTLGVLLLWLYRDLRSPIWLGNGGTDPNFSHGFFVPLFAGFVIWQERDRLARIKPQPAWSGALILGLGLCVLILGQMGAEIFLARFSLLIVLAGLTVLFLGGVFFRAILFSLGFPGT